ncbi:MAG TPA: cytochrome c biogenesis protein CcdA, partial [Dehalococcoidia bacterium]|nr:cytochrome c biogenesis protein CcdA [Dehalococcoidia bacterium]
ITNLLARSGYGPGGSDVRVLWATAEYFRFSQQPGLATQYDVEENLVFFFWENIHDGDLPEALRPVLRLGNGATYSPAQVLVPANAVHHRFSVATYPRYDAGGAPVLGDQARSLELVLPQANDEGAQSVLYWALPIVYPSGLSQARFQFTWASLLALLGGVLSSMWPCLFQLTAYFIPTLSGISMSQAQRRDNPALVRLRVMKTAAFFILGFAIVYTAAGAAAGFAAQSLNGTSLFWTLRRPFSIVAGLVILVMALRLAANARAPLVCKMPVASSLSKKNTGYLGTMLLGLAFATGCTTCFGAALILGIITYVGIAGTPLMGALIMLLFSLGMAIPLMAGAVAMARILGFLYRLEKVAPYMILASSAIMAGFAALLLSGRFMGLSNWLFSNVPL